MSNELDSVPQDGVIIPFAVQFAEEAPSEECFNSGDGSPIVEMSNPTRIGDEGDESC